MAWVACDVLINMADVSDEFGYTINIPVSFPPPPPPTMSFNEGKNLMKSPASLIGKDERTLKRSVMDECKNFLRLLCQKDLSLKELSWYYYNNDIDACLQDGPTCGMIALKLASDVLKVSGNLPAEPMENEIAELLQMSKDNEFTCNGEMFSARDMASLAKMYYGINYKILQSGLGDYVGLLNHVIKGYPVVVPYDSDKNNEPCLKKGHNAHWAVVTGFLLGLKDIQKHHDDTCHDIHLKKITQSFLPSNFEKDNLFIIARHGKSRHYGLWQLDNLNNSNTNLVEFDHILGTNSEGCLLTEGIQEGLCSKVLFFNPEL